MNNPFTTTFGIKPKNAICRLQERKKIIDEFESESPSNYVYLITGMRGSGKTVFMSNIAEHFKKDINWIVVNIGPKDNILESIAAEIYEIGLTKKFSFNKEFSFSFHGLTFSLKGKTPVTSVFVLIKKMLDVVKKKKKRVLITIDEVDNSPQMKTFVEAYQTLLREEYPVMLLMTGLYENISRLQENKSLTFLYRAPQQFLGPLDIRSIALSYSTLLGVEIKKAKQLALLTSGYAYAYQLLGYLCFDLKQTDINQTLLNSYDNYLGNYVYEKVYIELSEVEKNIVKAFTNDKIKTQDLCKRAKIKLKAFSVYRDRLIKKGVIFSPTYGYVQFALPRFYDFLLFKD